MLLHIVARGKIGRSPEAELVERYLKRISWPTKVTELPDRGGKAPEPAIGAVSVVLDERGKTLSSTELAKRLENWRDGGKREVRFLIGAADGHDEEQRQSADLLLSFGAATWPHMAAQEERHLKRFNDLMAHRRGRPTMLQPFWNVAGFALGAATALMSEKAALACTDAVETEIDRHYQQQLDDLGEDDPELAADIAEFRAEELEHRDTAREAGAAEAIGYPLLTAAIRAGCRVAIGLSKRI